MQRNVDRTLCRFLIFASWLTFTNSVVCSPVPNLLVARDANYRIPFTPDAGDPQDFDNDVKLLLGDTDVYEVTIHFNGRQPQTFIATDSDLPPFPEPGCVFLHLQPIGDRSKFYPHRSYEDVFISNAYASVELSHWLHSHVCIGSLRPPQLM